MLLEELLSKHYHTTNYEIRIYRLIGNKEHYCDYADKEESPYEKYLQAYLKQEVLNFSIVVDKGDIYLKVLVN